MENITDTIKPVYNSLVLEAICLIFHLDLRFKSTSLHILQTLKNRHAQAYANVKSVQRGGGIGGEIFSQLKTYLIFDPDES